MRSGPPLLVLLAVLAALLATPAARADGDPASDFLLSSRVFLSFESPLDSGEGRELEALTLEAAQRGTPIRVAVIAQPSDLGAIPELYGKAQEYATFLGRELTFVYRGTLVVVMAGTPGGVGLFGPAATPRGRTALHGLAVPTNGTPRELARIAATAVRNVAAAAGTRLTTPPPGPASGGGGVSAWVIVPLAGIGVLAAAAPAAFILLRSRRRPR